jgi:hypothetical protein
MSCAVGQQSTSSIPAADALRLHRAILTADQVVEIYQLRSQLHTSIEPGEQQIRGRTLAVAKRFGVSPKTVRDIWNRRSWANETCHLWAPGEFPVLRSRLQKSSDGNRAESTTGSSTTSYRKAAPPKNNLCPSAGRRSSNIFQTFERFHGAEEASSCSGEEPCIIEERRKRMVHVQSNASGVIARIDISKSTSQCSSLALALFSPSPNGESPPNQQALHAQGMLYVVPWLGSHCAGSQWMRGQGAASIQSAITAPIPNEPLPSLTASEPCSLRPCCFPHQSASPHPAATLSLERSDTASSWHWAILSTPPPPPPSPPPPIPLPSLVAARQRFLSPGHSSPTPLHAAGPAASSAWNPVEPGGPGGPGGPAGPAGPAADDPFHFDWPHW